MSNTEVISEMEFLYPNRFMYLILLILILIIMIKVDFVKLREKSPVRDKLLARRRKIYRILIFISRAIVIALLVTALSNPFMDIRKKLDGDRTLTMLVDNSKSLELYNKGVINTLKTELEKDIPVKIASICSGLRSNIGDGILANLGMDRNVLIVTDGNNNFGTELGDVSLFAADLNATLNVLQLEPKEMDMSVSIDGPSKVLAESENEFKVVVESTKPLEQYKLKVLINEQVVVDDVTKDEETSFTQKFSEGYYKIEARIESRDYFPENNVFYKTVHVVKKPKVLLVSTKESHLFVVMDKLYDTTRTNMLAGVNLDDYYAVVLDDVHAESLSRDDVNNLDDFVNEGNGLVVVGGERSYEFGAYKDSLFSNMLPVKVGAAEKEPKPDLNAVVLIDISRGKEYTNLTLGKTRAYYLMDQFRQNDNVAVVAFADTYTVLSGMSKIINKDMKDVKSKIAKLKEKDCMLKRSCSNVGGALEGVRKMLEGTSGRRYIFLLSDMDFGLGAGEIQYIADQMNEKNIIIFPTLVFNFYVGDYFYKTIPPRLEINMINFADLTGGTAFFPKNYEYMSFIFGKKPADEEEKGLRNVVVYNAFHFITHNLEPSAVLYGFNQVIPKSNARMLLATSQGEPILTVWRYGLGRVASFSTDDGNAWSGGVFNERNSRMVSRMMNWAIGDPERKEKYFIRIDDTRTNKTTDIIVKSEKFPKAEDLTFYKTGENIYTSKIESSAQGFNEVIGVVYASNYDAEYQKLGINPELQGIVESSNGKIFKSDEHKEIMNHVIKRSERFDIIKKKMMWPFITAALIIFLVEVSIRRIVEQKQNG